MMEISHSTDQILDFFERTKQTAIGEVVEGFGQKWLCHKYDFRMKKYRCDLCDFHTSKIPCVAVCCSCANRDDLNLVYFTSVNKPIN